MCEICIFAFLLHRFANIIILRNLRFCTSKLCSMLGMLASVGGFAVSPAELFKCMKAWRLEADDNSRSHMVVFFKNLPGNFIYKKMIPFQGFAGGKNCLFQQC